LTLLHHDEALEHRPSDGAVFGDAPLVRTDEVRKQAAVGDVGLGAPDLAVAEIDVHGLS
jgi:hypothetical protein